MVFLCLPGDPADTDYTAVGCAITTISSNLTEMSKGVKLLAALMDDEVGSGEDLLRAARTLAGAVSDLLKAVQPTSGEVSSWGKQSLSFSETGASSCSLSCSFRPAGGCYRAPLPPTLGHLVRCNLRTNTHDKYAFKRDVSLHPNFHDVCITFQPAE